MKNGDSKAAQWSLWTDSALVARESWTLLTAVRCEFAGKHCTLLEYCVQLFSGFNDKTGNKKCGGENTKQKMWQHQANDVQNKRIHCGSNCVLFVWLTSHPVHITSVSHKNNQLGYIHLSENQRMTSAYWNFCQYIIILYILF